jgi:hypothetical protein
MLKFPRAASMSQTYSILTTKLKEYKSNNTIVYEYVEKFQFMDVLIRDGAVLKNKCISPEGSDGLFLTCGQKERVSYMHTYSTVIIVTHKHKTCYFTHIVSYIPE